MFRCNRLFYLKTPYHATLRFSEHFKYNFRKEHKLFACVKEKFEYLIAEKFQFLWLIMRFLRFFRLLSEQLMFISSDMLKSIGWKRSNRFWYVLYRGSCLLLFLRKLFP